MTIVGVVSRIRHPLLLLGGLLASQASIAAQERADPFAFFQPSVVVTGDERARLDRGDAIVRVLPAESAEVAVFAAVRVDADGDRLAAWIRDIAALKKSPFVKAIARFSDPPRLEDLEALALDDEDLEAIRRCRPGSCQLKLGAAEIASLQEAIRAAPDSWKATLQAAFRQAMLARVHAYLAGGHGVLAPYADRDDPPPSLEVFALILRRSAYLAERLPAFVDYLDRYPHAPVPARVESFVYWSKEQLAGKASVNATHVSMRPSDDDSQPELLVAGKQIFATHYMNGSLSITAIVRGPSGQRYLVSFTRSRVDVLGRWFGGVARMVIERRLRREASEVLQGLRRRLESGEPPGEAGAPDAR